MTITLSPAEDIFFEVAQKIAPDLQEAQRFLEHMVGNAGQITFQTFDDTAAKRKHLAKSFENSPMALDQLADMNLGGAGCFWTVNECDGTGKRCKENAVAVRFVFVDLDHAPLQPVIDAGLKPTAIVESSPGRYHVYWGATDCVLEMFEKLQKALADMFDGDPKVCDLTRVMRLPGFIHQKGEPFKTRIIELNESSYTVEDIVNGLGLEKTAAQLPPGASHTPSTSGGLYEPKDEGGRNDALFKAGSDLQKHGVAGSDLKNILYAINATYPAPLSVSEVDQILASLRRYEKTEGDKPRKLVLLTWAKIVSLNIPKSEAILPWLTQQSLVMIYAWRGVGKTWVSLGIAIAVATGGRFLKWQVQKPHKVLYLDGEMPAYAIQERLKLLAPNGSPYPENLQILTPDFQPEGMPDLSTPAGQAEIDTLIAEDTTLIIVDNISALCRSGKENEAEGWIPVQTWALRQRAAGRSVLFVHHAGKAGAQRGSSKREDLLDTVIMLKRPGGYTADKGAEFEVHFEKARHLAGEETVPFVAKLDATGAATWTITDIENSVFDKVVELANLGLKQADIASELGVNKSTVSRNLQKAKDAGMLTKT